MRSKPLIMIPTYNERENVERICIEILALGLDLDILFVDDNSPDGTGVVLDILSQSHPNVKILHRSGKLGIGSAHRDGIEWGYKNGYRVLVTMDCDYTHPPEYIPRFLELAESNDVVVGSRYMQKNSLSGWSISRKTLTLFGHFLTKQLLGIPYDATGAYRSYRLDRITYQTFNLVNSHGYSFFFESLYILNRNQHSVCEIPIALPARTYGHSKMSYKEAVRSAKQLFYVYFTSVISPETFVAPRHYLPAKHASVNLGGGWESYWSNKKQTSGLIYNLIAIFYRKCFIGPSLNHFFRLNFNPGADVLHAGCGGGQVDTWVNQKYKVTALDISANALSLYERVNKTNSQLVLGDIFALPFADGCKDGIYNLGVMAHFTEDEILQILAEFYRVLKLEGKIILFWPPEFGLGVMVRRGSHAILNLVFKREVRPPPAEITRVKSERHVRELLLRSHFEVTEYYFGLRDAFTYSVIVARKNFSRRELSLASDSTGTLPL